MKMMIIEIGDQNHDNDPQHREQRLVLDEIIAVAVNIISVCVARGKSITRPMQRITIINRKKGISMPARMEKIRNFFFTARPDRAKMFWPSAFLTFFSGCCLLP